MEDNESAAMDAYVKAAEMVIRPLCDAVSEWLNDLYDALYDAIEKIIVAATQDTKKCFFNWTLRIMSAQVCGHRLPWYTAGYE